MCDGGEPPLDQAETCREFHFDKIQTRREDAERLNVPLIITEFGACSNSMSCFSEISGACDAFDDSLASWAHWQYKGFGDFTTTGNSNEGLYDNSGNVQDNKLRALTRTYVHAF